MSHGAPSTMEVLREDLRGTAPGICVRFSEWLTCPRAGAINHENSLIGKVFAPRPSGQSLWGRPPPEWASVGDLAQRWESIFRVEKET